MGHGGDNIKTIGPVRADIWLWAIRVFKTRSLATKACKSGKVKINSVAIKPAKLIDAGDVLIVKRNGVQHAYRVIEPINKRKGFEQAKLCYADITPEEELQKLKQRKESLGSVFHNAQSIKYAGKGRPTKKIRRDLDKFRPED
jgi:ribosome-associated heat shock protein Hsp15